MPRVLEYFSNIVRLREIVVKHDIADSESKQFLKVQVDLEYF